MRGTVWLAWVCFVLASYVYATYVMMRKQRCYSFSLAMCAGCMGLAVGARSHVSPVLSGTAAALCGVVVAYFSVVVEEKKWSEKEKFRIVMKNVKGNNIRKTI